MGEGRKKGPDGGGASLNFKVKDYATEELLMAATGKDNEIGIITSTPMTGWYLAAEQPEEMAEGEVWISTGTASQVAFNALKKGGTVMVYPISAKQMQGGTLVDVTAKSWQNGEWKGIATYLLKGGVDATEITGGWIGYAATVKDYAVAPTVEFVDGVLHIYHADINSGRYGIGATKNMIDLAEVTTLHFNVSSVESVTPVQVGAWTISGTKATLAAGVTDISDGCNVAVDVSNLSDSYYIGALIGRYGSKGSAHIYLRDIYWE